MNHPYSAQDALFFSIFSDETVLFRQPAEPEPGDRVAVRLRIQKGADARVSLLKGFPGEQVHMSKLKSDEVFDWYEAELCCQDEAVDYAFLIEWQGRCIYYDRRGPRWAEAVPALDPAGAFRVLPGFHVPEWAKGALQYQIMPDRFRNGSGDNDVQDREYFYANGFVRHAASWDAPPEAGDFRCFYGGDLPGVMEKLDYLQSLGVEAIYFNPIFVSPSSHKYDVQDFDHVDPHLTVIPMDGGEALAPEAEDNAGASLYMRRVTDPANLEASDAWFAGVCREVHRRGMRIILDGVFNHCGSFHRWMDREGLYGGERGAYGHPDSPYRSFFGFRDDGAYDCWWDVETLPKLYYGQSAELCERILGVAEKWVRPPYCVDGWRLDVAADLGLTRAFNHRFWKAFRRRVKAANPEALILAEHYGDPSEWLGGDEWDSVMNYDAFMEPLSFFLTGMEKHSDARRDDLYQDGAAFFRAIFEAMSRLPTPSLHCAMDQLSNHDHSRFLTRTNGRVGRLHTLGGDAASEGVHPEVFREAAVIQMTWPGAPTIYYGDEAGLAGWTDPDNRRAYPWGREDAALVDFHRALAQLRGRLPALRRGSVKPLCAGHGHIAYARFDGESAVAVVCNNADQPLALDLRLRDIGVVDGTPVRLRFITTSQGFSADATSAGVVEAGVLRFDAPARSAAILVPDRS